VKELYERWLGELWHGDYDVAADILAEYWVASWAGG
jgi:hypothetical protein